MLKAEALLPCNMPNVTDELLAKWRAYISTASRLKFDMSASVAQVG